MASNFINNSNLVQQALADRSALNSYQNLMDTIGSGVGNMAQQGAQSYQNNKIMQALQNRQNNQGAGTANGYNSKMNVSSAASLMSGLPGFNKAANIGVSPVSDEDNNSSSSSITNPSQNDNNSDNTGLNYQAGIEQAIKYGRWDVANNLGQAQQREKENALNQQNFDFNKDKLNQAQQQQDIENAFNEKQLAQQKELALKGLEIKDYLARLNAEKESKNEAYRETQQQKNLMELNQIAQKQFEGGTVSGKALANARDKATTFQETSNSLQQMLQGLDTENMTNSKIGRILDKIGSQYGITTQGSTKLDDLRMVNSQIQALLAQDLYKGQGAISDYERKSLPNVFMFTSDGRIKNNIKNFTNFLKNNENRLTQIYNKNYEMNKPAIERMGLQNLYSPMESSQNNQYAPKEFTIKSDKSGQQYKVYSDGRVVKL